MTYVIGYCYFTPPGLLQRILMKNGHILAIDQGTTGTKVLIFDHDANIKALAYSEFTQHYPKPGWVEHDAEEIWTISINLVAEALSKANIRASEIKAIGITNQRETSVLWDRLARSPHGWNLR